MRTTFDPLFLPVAFLVLLWFNHRLITAYRQYLRFDHAGATVLASKTITALAVWKLVLVIQGF
jgi:hypothetical protein